MLLFFLTTVASSTFTFVSTEAKNSLHEDERIINPLSRHEGGFHSNDDNHMQYPMDIFDRSIQHNDGADLSSQRQPGRSHFVGDDPNERNVANHPSTSPNPSNFPSTAPSANPSASPTMQTFPSASPTVKISLNPSTTPSTSPTNDCTLDDSGLFGAETTTNVTVEYEYEIEYKSISNLSRIIKDIEVMVGQSIIPILFPETCSANNLQRTLRKSEYEVSKTTSNSDSMNEARILAQRIFGFTILPDDQVRPRGQLKALPFLKELYFTLTFFSTGKCQQFLDASDNQCSVVHGKMTLFIDSNENWEETGVLNAINAVMILGNFNYLQGVKRVTFRNSKNPASSRSVPDSSGSFPLWAIMLIIVGCLVFVGIIVSIWRRRKSRINADNSLSERGEFDKFGQEASVKDFFPSSETNSENESQESDSRVSIFGDPTAGQGSNYHLTV